MVHAGTDATLEAVFVDDDGTRFDPFALSLTLTTPTGTVTADPITRTSTGTYTYTWPVPADLPPGQYTATWTATMEQGDPPVTAVDTITVDPPTTVPPTPQGVCLWPLPEGEDCLPPEWYTLPDAVRYRGRLLASRTMERLTGHRVAVCPVTVRPCRVHTGNCEYDAGSLTGVGVVNWAGTWSNQSCARGCAHRCEVPLPAPVGRVDQVKVDGQVLAPIEYTVDDGYLLTWTGQGECPFPFGQDINAPDTEPGTMSVTYVNGHLPGPDGEYAAAVLAHEYALACAGRRCRLPDGVTTIVRQGISMTLTPGSFPDGKTGIREVDAYLGVWNPHGHLVPPVVWSPDLPVNRVVG